MRLVFSSFALVFQRHIFFCFLFILLGLLGACQREQRAFLKKKGEQVIYINYLYTPFSADPRKSTDPVTTVTYHMLYEGLTRIEPDGTVVPAVAERIEISEDQQEYRFFLKKTMWSDGSPLTAYDFLATWKKALSPAFISRSAHLFFPIKNGKEAKLGECAIDEVGIEAIDEYTLFVRLSKPTPYFLQLTAYPTYFPVPHNGDEVARPSQQGNLISNGPFCLASWKDGDEIVAIKNRYYWNAEEVKLEEVHATIVSDEATVLKLFEQGKLDYIGGLLSPLPLDAIPTLKREGHLCKQAIGATTFTTFNVKQFPFNNSNIRKAFAFAIDKREIIDHITQMFDDVAVGLVPMMLKDDDEKGCYQQDYQPSIALDYFKMGLQELGITKQKFPSITYSFFNTEIQKNLAIALQSRWRKVLGVEIKLEARELKSHLTKLHHRQFQIGQMSWIEEYHDRLCFLERFVDAKRYCNYSGWESRYYQQLIDDSFYQREERRKVLLQKAETVLMDEMPIIPLYHFHAIYLKNPHLRQIAISPRGDIQFHKAFLD